MAIVFLLAASPSFAAGTNHRKRLSGLDASDALIDNVIGGQFLGHGLKIVSVYTPLVHFGGEGHLEDAVPSLSVSAMPALFHASPVIKRQS